MKKFFRKRIGVCAIKAGGIGVAVLVMIFLAIFRTEKKPPITIGAIIPLSGSASSHIDVADGIAFAADEVNARGGINGREIRIVLEDSRSDPEEGQNAFHRIEADDQPVAYIASTSAVSMALAPLAEEHQVVLLGLIVVTPELTRQRAWVFRYFASAESELRPTLYHLKTLHVKTLGIIYQRDAFGIPMFEHLSEAFTRIGGHVESAAFDVSEEDHAAQIDALRGMEAIYAVGFPSHMEHILTQLRQQQYPGIILGGMMFSDPEFRMMPEANGVYVAAPFTYNANYPFAQAVKERFEERYKKPFNQRAANGYDVVKLLALLLEDRKISREQVRTLLEQGFLYSGVFGDIELKPGEHEIVIPVYPARVVDQTLEFFQ